MEMSKPSWSFKISFSTRRGEKKVPDGRFYRKEMLFTTTFHKLFCTNEDVFLERVAGAEETCRKKAFGSRLRAGQLPALDGQSKGANIRPVNDVAEVRLRRFIAFIPVPMVSGAMRLSLTLSRA